MERPVRRSELHSPQSTPDPPPDPEAIARLKQLNEFEYLGPLSPPGSFNETTTSAVDDEDLDFRLFATSKTDAQTTGHKIRLRSPTPQTSAPGFISAQRSFRYYFTDSVDSEAKEKFEDAALSAEQINFLSNIPWPGTTYEWKVMRVPASSLTPTAQSQVAAPAPNRAQDGSSNKRTRPGKKTRIRIRTKLAASRAKQEVSKKQAEEREAAEKEKRTKRNREKKVKKKLREKAKRIGGGKTELAADGGEASEGD